MEHLVDAYLEVSSAAEKIFAQHMLESLEARILLKISSRTVSSDQLAGELNIEERRCPRVMKKLESESLLESQENFFSLTEKGVKLARGFLSNKDLKTHLRMFALATLEALPNEQS
jgi:Mn-dependent DtxR family transcriptional regulator